MFDALTEHLNPGMFLIALAGHVVAESSAKIALNSIRQLGYLAAVLMLPVLMRIVAERQKHNDVPTEARGNRQQTRGHRIAKS
ncbi:MAG: hypothetical protein JNN22_04965 [Rhodospirillales bacterium]|nr:hypothetical protein [Rhodospirillales bacterium]